MTSTLQFVLDPPLENVQSHLGFEGYPYVDEAGEVQGDLDERKSNKDGHTGYWKVEGKRAYVLIRPEGYEDARFDVDLPHNDVVTVTLTKKPVRLPVLSAVGTQLYGDGQPQFLRGASAFMLYRDYLDGQNRDVFLNQLSSLGCNLLRVFGMCHYIPINQGQAPFAPQSYGERYYNSLTPFAEMLAARGFYLLWTNFPDNGLIMPDLGTQLRHHGRVVDALEAAPASLYELTNERGAHDFNDLDVRQFFQPTKMLSCVSGYGDEYGSDLPPGPYWSFGNFHPPRRYPSHIKDCCAVDHPFALKLNRPVLLGEPDRYGSGGNPNKDQARQSAGAARQTSMGFVFHSANGRDGRDRLDDQTMLCAEACFGGMR